MKRALSDNPKTKRARERRWLKNGGSVVDIPRTRGGWSTPLLPHIATGQNALIEQKYFPPERKKPTPHKPKPTPEEVAHENAKQPVMEWARDDAPELPVETSPVVEDDSWAVVDEALAAKARAARENGARGGKVKSEAKAKAARENGARGGRPKNKLP